MWALSTAATTAAAPTTTAATGTTAAACAAHPAEVRSIKIKNVLTLWVRIPVMFSCGVGFNGIEARSLHSKEDIENIITSVKTSKLVVQTNKAVTSLETSRDEAPINLLRVNNCDPKTKGENNKIIV